MPAMLLLSAALSPEETAAQSSTKSGTQSEGAVRRRENYRIACVPCHGPEGKGVLPGTDLTSGQWKHGSTLQAIAKTISEGVPGTAMLPAKDRFTKEEILELARLVRSFEKTSRKPPAKKK